MRSAHCRFLPRPRGGLCGALARARRKPRHGLLVRPASPHRGPHAGEAHAGHCGHAARQLAFRHATGSSLERDEAVSALSSFTILEPTADTFRYGTRLTRDSQEQDPRHVVVPNHTFQVSLRIPSKGTVSGMKTCSLLLRSYATPFFAGPGRGCPFCLGCHCLETASLFSGLPIGSRATDYFNCSCHWVDNECILANTVRILLSSN